ncbi:hypothetical protein PoB_002098600 [Plakobranchus ocellatus]|uniref:Uncharacterized protein n=1 Tax=Plakobranchus ocellatus TaxID=259542 RepID=A0AAV3ZIM3_9GAST|nr:hypothetical protein PoB_002098600 [Plakobranchus ocellatus]
MPVPVHQTALSAINIRHKKRRIRSSHRETHSDLEGEKSLEVIEDLVWSSAPGIEFNKSPTIDRVNSIAKKARGQKFYCEVSEEKSEKLVRLFSSCSLRPQHLHPSANNLPGSRHLAGCN